MKTNLIRAFVVALAFAGFSASSVSAKTATTVSTKTVNVTPTPLCAPSDPTHCGMD